MKNNYILIIVLNILMMNIICIANNDTKTLESLPPELKLEIIEKGTDLGKIIQSIINFSLSNKKHFALVTNNKSYIASKIKNKFSEDEIEEYAESLSDKASELKNPNLINNLKFMKDFDLLPDGFQIAQPFIGAVINAFKNPDQIRLEILNKFFRLGLVHPNTYVGDWPVTLKVYPFATMLKLATHSGYSRNNVKKVLDYTLKNNPTININQYDLTRTNFILAFSNEGQDEFIFTYLLQHGANPTLPIPKKLKNSLIFALRIVESRPNNRP